MKLIHPNNPTRRMLTKSWRYRGGVLLMMLIAFGLMTIQPVVGQTKNMGKDIPAGLDMFKTAPNGTRFQFRDELTIPAGFFDENSSPFAGAISFKGAPIGSFKEQKTGDVDTIVERKSAAQFYGRQARATVPIEVVALSLESTRPIRVRVGKEWQSWNVKLELSPSRKSEGTMTLTRRNEKGGTFNSELLVYALFTFTREGDGMQRRLDTSEMKLDKRSIEMVTLRATAVPWVLNCSQSRSDFCPGVTTAGNLVVVSHNAPRHRHLILLPTPQD
jgi:hypothetical protein